MFGFSVRTWQNAVGSPKAVSTPNFRGPSGGHRDSPRASIGDVGEIDTRAPFESVKAAVSLFGEVVTPRARPITKKTRAEEQKLLEKETQHVVLVRELDYYKDQIKSIENAKAQALRELRMAKKTLQELTNQLDTVSESKQAAFMAAEEAKQRTKELEEKKSLHDLSNSAWKMDIDAERELYRECSVELIDCKQELNSLRQDVDLAIEEKLEAFHRLENATRSSKKNGSKQSQLAKEVAMLTETLDRVKTAAVQSEEEHLKLIAEKEVHFLVHKSAQEVADRNIKQLRQELLPEENLQGQLEEATEAVKVLQEQLNDVRTMDMHALQAVVSELDTAKTELQEAVEEESLIRSSVDSTRVQIEDVRRKLLESHEKVIRSESVFVELQSDLRNAKAELQQAASSNVVADMVSNLQRLTSEAGKNRDEADEISKRVALLRQQEEEATLASHAADEKLELAVKEAEAAKMAEKLADEQLKASPKGEAANADLKDTGANKRIRMSTEEFKSIPQKIEDCRKEADLKVSALMAQAHGMNASEQTLLQKAEAMLKESEAIQMKIDQALKHAEEAESMKLVLEVDLRRWRK